jgi:hypothetical protein
VNPMLQQRGSELYSLPRCEHCGLAAVAKGSVTRASVARNLKEPERLCTHRFCRSANDRKRAMIPQRSAQAAQPSGKVGQKGLDTVSKRCIEEQQEPGRRSTSRRSPVHFRLIDNWIFRGWVPVLVRKLRRA